MSSTCRAPRAADTPGALHCRHGFINATLWTFLLSMHFSKPFHRFISFSFSSSLKSIPDGQKLFLNWPCNSSSYINPPTMSLPSARGCTLLPGRSLFPLQGGEALRAGKWSQISQALRGVGWKAGDQLQACHLVPQPSPPPTPLLCLAQCCRTWRLEDPRVPADPGDPSITSVKSRRQRWRWEDKIQRTKMFVWVTFKILFFDIHKYEVSK